MSLIKLLVVAGPGILQMPLSIHQKICPQHLLAIGTVPGAQDTLVRTDKGSACKDLTA